MAKVLIVGAGVSGLSAGIYARLCGHETVICERQAVAGGNLMGWKRGGYEIDNCIHWLTGTNRKSGGYKIWKELGALGGVKVHQAESLYTVEKNGKTLTLWQDVDRLERDMLALSPADGREIKKLIRAIKLVQAISGCGQDKKGHARERTLFDFLAAPKLLRYHTLSTGEYAEKFRHSTIKSFITAVTEKPFSALAFIVTAATFCSGNGGVPQGGSRAMAERMVKRFEKLGGKLYLSREVVKIEHEGGMASSAVFASGGREPFDYVIITADPTCIFGKVLDVPMPKEMERRYSDPKMIRFSSYHFAFSCPVDELTFQGDYIFDLGKEARKALKTDRLILREFSHEKEFAPAGKTVLQSLTFCKEKDCFAFIKLRKNKTAYEEKKRELAKKVEEEIIKKFPALAGKLKLLDGWTSATYERYTGSETGSYMSFIFTPKQNPAPLSCGVKGLKNVFLATQWQQLPGGLPNAAKMGKRAVEALQRRERVLSLTGQRKAQKKVSSYR
ncbi:MAG: NAD(P)/FAD-dependent oxidoreductase [Clostridia bacterium]|nr:NAD(P)/FAD-dependent oxidoreductase [Clostridia bacterium]